MLDIRKILCKLNIDVTELQVNQLIRYYELLVEKNKVMNLTAITEFDDVVIKHFADSAAIVNCMELNNGKKIIDVGTGAGFPGMVLKILFPETEITLLDSLNKRIKFLDEVIDELGLKNICTVHGRAEDIARMEMHREKYDLCVSRAVADLAALSEYCIPFVKKEGYFISYKSAECEEEAEAAKKAVKILGGRIENINECVLPESDIVRKFVVIHKENKTSTKYPRKAGMPTKEPLR